MESKEGEIETANTTTADLGINYNQNGAIYSVPNNPFVVPVNGFISPALIAITLITNCAVCAVLLRPHMRSPTNILLVAIATSDMLTGQ